MVTVVHFCFYDASGLNESQYLPTGAEFQLLQYTGRIQLFGFCDVRLIYIYLIYAVNLYILIAANIKLLAVPQLLIFLLFVHRC